MRPVHASVRPRSRVTFKFILIGDKGVGKTALARRFTQGRPGASSRDETECAIGIVEGREANFEIQAPETTRFQAAPASSLGTNKIAFLCVDSTNRTSFENAANWLRDIERHGEHCPSTDRKSTRLTPVTVPSRMPSS